MIHPSHDTIDHHIVGAVEPAQICTRCGSASPQVLAAPCAWLDISKDIEPGHALGQLHRLAGDLRTLDPATIAPNTVRVRLAALAGELNRLARELEADAELATQARRLEDLAARMPCDGDVAAVRVYRLRREWLGSVPGHHALVGGETALGAMLAALEAAAGVEPEEGGDDGD